MEINILLAGLIGNPAWQAIFPGDSVGRRFLIEAFWEGDLVTISSMTKSCNATGWDLASCPGCFGQHMGTWNDKKKHKAIIGLTRIYFFHRFPEPRKAYDTMMKFFEETDPGPKVSALHLRTCPKMRAFNRSPQQKSIGSGWVLHLKNPLAML